MNHIILFEPEIPQNTGNIIRLCVNTGFYLHLVEPLGFVFNSRKLRRAGLDYHALARVNIYSSWTKCRDAFTNISFYALSIKGTTLYTEARFELEKDIALLFGPETRGLPAHILESLPSQQILRLPMQQESRCLNLSNTVAIMAYELWRRQDFIGGQ